MQTITETIDQLTHEELKQYCIQQNQNNLNLMAEIEALKADLAKPDRLENVLNFLFFLDQTLDSFHCFKTYDDSSGRIVDINDKELFEFDSFDHFLEIANSRISEHNKLNQNEPT